MIDKARQRKAEIKRFMNNESEKPFTYSWLFTTRTKEEAAIEKFERIEAYLIGRYTSIIRAQYVGLFDSLPANRVEFFEPHLH